MKKGIIFAVMVIIAVLATAAGAGAYYIGSLQRGNAFLEGTKVNGRNVSGQTPAQATAAFAADFKEGQVVIEESGKEVFRSSLQDLGYAMDEKSFEESLTGYMESEKTDIQQIFNGLVNGNAFTLDFPYTFDEEVYKNAVKKEALTEPRKENKNAKIVYDEEKGKCRIQPEVRGTQIHTRDLRAWLKEEIPVIFKVDNGNKDGQNISAEGENGQAGSTASAAVPGAGDGSGDAASENQNTKGTGDSNNIIRTEGLSITLSLPESLYILPDKLSTDENLVKKCDTLNHYAGNTITYVFGNESETLEFKSFMNWLKIRGDNVTVRQEKVTKYVSELAAKYETRYKDRVFYTTWGGEVVFPASMNDYGYTILEDQEAAQLTQDILSGESVSREPVYMTVSDWGDPLYLSRNGMDDLNGTYVEVSIGAQHMWYYQNWQLVVESDVVTGDITQNMGTATGVFPLAYKESPSTLRGGEGKKKYTTKVQYWMPFYEGQGLHDAWWKTVFGGDEYKGNGSHGCVNLPSSVAETLYNNIVPGTAIIIYN